jgi:beta-phosphoglucomutase-like phosphatase (HAD superfamily)
LKPKALIFDMDGVLVDSEPLHERAKREAFRKTGIVLPEQRFATLIGRGDEAMLKDLASEFSLSAEQSAEILRQKNAFTNRRSLRFVRYRALLTLFIGHISTSDLPWRHRHLPDIGTSL